jgi:hypothetical protein
VDGELVVLPGCGAQLPENGANGWSRLVDGTSPSSGEAEATAEAELADPLAFANNTLLRHPFACAVSPFDPAFAVQPGETYTEAQARRGCQQWRSEGAALSWNALIGFAALSAPEVVVFSEIPGLGVTPGLTPVNAGVGDPINCRFALGLDAEGNVVVVPSANAECYKPALIDELDVEQLFRTDGCSFVRPQLCREARKMWSLAVTELGDDPSGEPRLRWFHESGAAYKIVEARGAYAGYLGGVVHAYGPVESAVAGAAAGVPILVAPPACNDGRDNDGDELVDFPEDTSCRAPAWDSEEACGRGFAQALVLIVPVWWTRRLVRARTVPRR